MLLFLEIECSYLLECSLFSSLLPIMPNMCGAKRASCSAGWGLHDACGGGHSQCGQVRLLPRIMTHTWFHLFIHFPLVRVTSLSSSFSRWFAKNSGNNYFSSLVAMANLRLFLLPPPLILLMLLAGPQIYHWLVLLCVFVCVCVCACVYHVCIYACVGLCVSGYIYTCLIGVSGLGAVWCLYIVLPMFSTCVYFVFITCYYDYYYYPSPTHSISEDTVVDVCVSVLALNRLIANYN